MTTHPTASTRPPAKGIGWWISPLRPLAIGIVVLAIVFGVAAANLPTHTVLIWSSTGDKALAASRSDFEVFVLIAGFVILGVYVVTAAVMALTPLRHVLVPNAAYWKTPQRHREMRHRYATYLGRVIGGTYVFIAAEIVVALLSQKSDAFEQWWWPTVVSLAFVLGLLIFAVWVFSDGFRPPRRSAASGRAADGRR